MAAPSVIVEYTLNIGQRIGIFPVVEESIHDAFRREIGIPVGSCQPSAVTVPWEPRRGMTPHNSRPSKEMWPMAAIVAARR
jgi:hypothetical protein